MVGTSRSQEGSEEKDKQDGNSGGECIFCNMSEEKISVDKIYANENFFSVYDKNQDIKGHALVISKQHFPTIMEMPDDISGDLTDCIKKTSSKLMQEENVEGFNVINNTNSVAGQLINHVHFHILPRRSLDGVNVPC